MIKRFFTVSVVVLTIFWAVGLTAFVPVAQAAISSGDLIKASLPAVYYYGADGKRYVFPDEKTYKTWYPDFSGVKTITDAELAAITIGGNVTYKPGAKMIKITTDPKVYAVQSNGTLRWVTTEAIAVCLYGATWNTMVNDVPDPFFVNYTVGAPINACTDYDKAAALAAAVSINVDKGLATGGNQAAFNAVLASDNPAAQTLAKSATGVPVLKFTLSGTGTLNEVILKRTGLGSASDYAAVYLYKGDVRLTSGRSISSDTNTVTFSNLNLAISGSVTLTAKVDVDTAADASDQNAISVNSINGNAVAGVMGNLMTIGNAFASDVDITRGSASWNVTLGTAGAELAKFSVEASTNDAIVYAITLVQGGRLSNSNLANLKLKVGSYELASVAVLSGDKAIFVLGAPYTITKGQMKNFTVIGDITGGRTNDDVSFYIDQKTDVNILDGLYGVGANVQIATDFDAPGDQTVTMQGGQLTLGNAGPASSTFSANTTGNNILKVNLSSERNVTVKKTRLAITTGGAAVDDDMAYIKNIKIYDLDSNGTLVGPVSSLDSFVEIDTDAIGDDDSICEALEACEKVQNETFDLTAGTTRHLAIRVDFDTLITDGLTLAATFDLSGTSYVYDNDSSEYVIEANIVPSSLVGTLQTVTTSSLGVSVAGTPTAGLFVQGATAVDSLGINLNAGIADSLKLNRLMARIYADDDGTFTTAVPSFTGDTAANYVGLTASLYDGSTLVKGPVNLSLVESGAGNGTFELGEYYRADFTNLAYAIPAGSQKKLVVRLALRNTMAFPPVNYFLAVDLIPSEDMEVENSMGNLLTGLSASHLTGQYQAAPTIVQTVEEVGGLTVSVDGNTPKADIVVAGSTNVNSVKYKIVSQDEAFTVTGLKIVNNYSATPGDLDKDVVNVKLTYNNASGSTVTKTGQLSEGVLTFTDGQLDMYVPVNSSAILTISADYNWVAAGAISGDRPILCLDNGDTNDDDDGDPLSLADPCDANDNLTADLVALGVSSNTKVYGDSLATVDNSKVKGMTVRKTKISSVNTSTGGASSIGPLNVIGRFKLNSVAESQSNQNSTLDSVDLTISGSLVAGAAGEVTLYKGSLDSANIMGTDAAFTLGSTATLTLTDNNEFTGEIEVLVVADTSDGAAFVDNAGSTDTLVTSMDTWTWDDGTGASATPVAGFPVVPQNALTY